MIKNVGFGKFGIQTGLKMRDSNLLRKILDAHSKTAVEWIYIDTGK